MWCVYDKHNQLVVAFPKEEQARNQVKTMANCKGAHVKEMELQRSTRHDFEWRDGKVGT